MLNDKKELTNAQIKLIEKLLAANKDFIAPLKEENAM